MWWVVLGVHVDVHGKWVMLRVAAMYSVLSMADMVYAETVESMRCVGSVRYVGV